MESGIKNCSFSFRCTQEWEKLSPTKNVNIKFCDVCKSNVYMATTQEELEKHSKLKRCIAIIDWQKIMFSNQPTPFAQRIKGARTRYRHLELNRFMQSLGYNEDDLDSLDSGNYIKKAKEIIKLGQGRGYLLYREIEPLMMGKKLEGKDLYDIVEACNDCGIILYQQTPTTLGSLNFR